jgi:hypothetical protein
MPLDSSQIARPVASVSMNGGTVSPDSVELFINVNSFPYASVKFHDKGAWSEKRSSVPTDMSSKMAADQISMYSGTSTSSAIQINDGLGGNIQMSGYSSGTAYNLLVGSIGQIGSIIHRSSILDNLNTGVYTFGAGPSKPDEDLSAPNGSGSYSSWMSSYLKWMITRWEAEKINSSADEFTKKLKDQIHTLNAESLQAWYSVLDTSEDTNSKLESLSNSKIAVMFKKAMHNALLHVYTNSYGSFMQTIQQICIMFQLMYIPAVEDGFGKFVPIRKAVEQELEKNVSILQMNITAGAKSTQPITQVVVHGLPGLVHKEGGQGNRPNAAEPALSIFPDSSVASAGRVYRTAAPIWLPVYMHPTKTDISTEESDLDPDSYTQARLQENKAAREYMDSDVKGLVDEWAKDLYVNLSLSPSSAQLLVPLDVTWEIGKTYKVTATGPKGQDPKNLFTGFLYGISHRLSSSSQSPEATTRLMFTHVQGEGFKLPGLE